MSKPVFEGRWNSGENASSLPASIAFEADGLSVTGADGAQLAFWKYRGLQPGAPIGKNAEDVLLRHSQAQRGTLFIQGPGIGGLLMERAPRTAQSFQRFKIVSYSMIATAIAVAAGMVLLFGRFSASKAIAELIPSSMADRIGVQNIGMFGPVAPACVNQPGNAALQHMLDRLQGGGNYGRPFKLHVAQSGIANAFALPGRHIVLLSGLVKQAKSPEEVAGIIAHEMGHGIEKDPEAQFVRNVGMLALLQFLTGQSGDQGPLTFGAILLQLRYSRTAERSADSHALEILRNAHIGSKPTADFFLRDEAGASAGDILNYLSTHPPSKERAELFLSQAPYPAQPLLSETEWEKAKTVCDEGGAKKPGEEHRPKPEKPAAR
ncbi:MAG: M48 family metallopeptidase, partial [Rhodomicrobium sp.]|nr:M48 family metallopeptidase [Rhodomicrobium sp.]